MRSGKRILLIVLAIVGLVLVWIFAWPPLLRDIQRSMSRRHISVIRGVLNAIETHRVSHGTYPRAASSGEVLEFVRIKLELIQAGDFDYSSDGNSYTIAAPGSLAEYEMEPFVFSDGSWVSWPSFWGQQPPRTILPMVPQTPGPRPLKVTIVGSEVSESGTDASADEAGSSE